MTSAGRILIGLWMVFIAYWLLSAIGVKRSVRQEAWPRGACLRAALLVLVLVLLHRQPFARAVGPYLHPALASSAALAAAGLAACALGMAFAVWARVNLGRNWGHPMSLKEGHELVTSGPYALVRHPIYGGMLFAILGSALVDGPFWLAVCLVLAAYFHYAAKTEDRLMAEQFPHVYPAYRERTKALVPFLF